jgi:hypothetical protein
VRAMRRDQAREGVPAVPFVIDDDSVYRIHVEG